MNKIQIGQKAPSFSLYDSAKKKVNSDDLKGRTVVLLFFPLAFTSVCTKEMCSVRDNISLYNKINAEVFGISVDSIYTLAKFKEEEGLNFTLLSDFNKEASFDYGVLYETFGYGMKGVAKRASFVIDREWNIVFVEVLENASDFPDFNGIVRALSMSVL